MHDAIMSSVMNNRNTHQPKLAYNYQSDNIVSSKESTRTGFNIQQIKRINNDIKDNFNGTINTKNVAKKQRRGRIGEV